VLRSRQQLVAIHPRNDVLRMTTMNFGDEILPSAALEELHEADIPLEERELDIARTLVESVARPFGIANYHDTYREALLELIDRKASGELLAVEPPAREEPLRAADLMSALEASIEQVRARRARDEAVLANGSAGKTPKGSRARGKRTGTSAAGRGKAAGRQDDASTRKGASAKDADSPAGRAGPAGKATTKSRKKART
jgi:DNA end-binding protein Ku